MSNVFVFRRPPHGVITEYFGGGKGGSTTTTNNVTQIPPEVLARYNAVNARAEAVAQSPYQAYSNDPNAFVAPLSATQQAGIQNTNIMAGAAQPYYGAATDQLIQAQAGAQPGINAAYQNVGQAQNVGNQYANAAAQQYGGAQGAAAPYYQAATQGTQQALQGAQPYQGLATAAALSGAQGVGPGALQTQRYMNPFTQNVVQATQAALNQQQGQQLAQQQADAIKGGAFGGGRAAFQRAQLEGQQSLAQAQAIAPLYQQNYQQALAAAQQQQGVGLGAAQANRAAIQQAGQQLGALGQQTYGQQLGAAQQMGNLGQNLYSQALGTGQAIQGLGQQQYGQGQATAQQLAALAQQGYGMGAGTSAALAGLGTNAQQAGLAGAQAQLAAGQTQQQTQQAGLQALYNQFQQQQGFPYQQAQFLANIAEGTGALSGNATSGTSTTTGGGGFFSDERLKENIKKVGETNDGQPIYRYNYKGDGRTQIGLLAQDVEKDHPEAVGLAGGYKTVDYKKATEDAVHKAEGGAAGDAYSMGAPSQMLQENSGKGLGAVPTLPQMVTGRDIPIETGANAAQVAAMRAPQATGYSLGTREGKQAELDSLLSSQNQPPGPNGALLGSGPGYIQSRIGTLQDWLNKNNSQGGLVSGPGNFAQGGLAGGRHGFYGEGYVNPALAYYSPQQAQQGVFQLQPMPQRQILQGTPMQAPQQRQQPDAVTSAMNMAKLVEMGNKARPDFLRSAADVAARQRTADALAAREQQYIDWAKEKGYPLPSDKKAATVDDKRADLGSDTTVAADDHWYMPDAAARGGMIDDRHHYSRGGINPYGGNSVLGPILEEQEQQPQPQMMKGPEAPGQKPQQKSGGLGELVDTGLKARSLYKGGEWAAGKLGLGAPETAMSATSAEALPGVIDLTSGAGLAGAGETATGLAGAGEAAAGLAGAEGLAAGAGLAELGTGAAAAGAGIMEALPFLAFLSDERAKHDIKKVGTLFDGQPVYRYAYNGDDKTQMGLLAQKVEKAAPEAVGLAGGMKTVNYEKATDKAAKRGHYQAGGLKPPTEDAPVVVEEVPLVAKGGNENAPTGGDGETKVPRAGLGAPLARPTSNVPTPENAVATVPAPREPKPAPGLNPSKSFFPEITSEGVRDTLSSENFWVPAIAGLGAMLASPNKTLAGAIGSGLVGGTGAYTGLQKQQSEIAKNSLDIFNKVFEQREDGAGNVAYMNLQTGKLSTPQEAFSYLKGMPGFSGLAKTPSAPAKEAPQRDATVALASDVVDKGVEPVAPRIPSAPPAGGVARAAANAPAETTVLAPGAPAAGAPPAPPARPAGAAPVAKPQEGEPPAIRLPEPAQKALLEADAWARSQPEVKAHIDEAKKQRALAQQAQDRLSGMVSPKMKEIAAKQFETANKQATEAETRAEAAVTRFVDPLHKEISRQLNTSPEAIAAAARLKAAEAAAVLDPSITGAQAAAAAEQTRLEEEAKARVGQRTRAYVDAETGTEYTLPVDETGKAVAPAPSRAEQGTAAPAPERAQIEPQTGKVIPGRPKPPAGGGSVIPNLPANASVTKLGEMANKQIAKDADFYEDMLGKSESLTIGSQRYNSIANAFKLFESGPGAGTQSDYAAIAKSWGYPDLAKRILDGDPEAVQLLQKEVPGLVLEQLKAATPRFAQSEFTALLDRGVPDASKLPGANFQMVAQGLAIMNRANAFMDSWPDAKAEGWRSMSAYYQAWSKANPLPEYMESAKRQMGNFAGMPLPPANKLAAGATYVTPKELDGDTRAAMGALGIKPGDIWRYNGPGEKVTVIPRDEMFSTHMGQ